MARRKGRRVRAGYRQADDPRGYPTHEHNVYTVEGEIEQWGNAVRALRYTQRHRLAARLLLGLIVGMLALTLLGAIWWVVELLGQ